METFPSWGTGRRGWAMEIRLVVIMRWERVTRIGPRGGSVLRPSPLRT